MYAELDIVGSGIADLLEPGMKAEKISSGYRVSGSQEQLERLLANGGFDSEIHAQTTAENSSGKG